MASAWLVWQIVDLLVENIRVPIWTMPAFQLTVAVGFPIVLIAAWLLELTPDGLRLQKSVDPAKSIARKTGRQLNRGIIMILAMGLVLFLTDRIRDEVISEADDNNPGPKATGQIEAIETGQAVAVLRSENTRINRNRNPV